MQRARAQILGVEALHTKDVRQTHRLLVEHLAQVRKFQAFSHCKLVLIFECATQIASRALGRGRGRLSLASVRAGPTWRLRASTSFTPSPTLASKTG
jgi:hypothetical protein